MSKNEIEIENDYVVQVSPPSSDDTIHTKSVDSYDSVVPLTGGLRGFDLKHDNADSNESDDSGSYYHARGNWGSQFEFFLSCLGYAVGLGNVWRFPYLCYTNGGGAFLIPYIVMFIGCGLPILLMEMAMGQYSSQGPLTVFALCPIFKGLGIGMVVCSVFMCIYYNVLAAWTVYYLIASITSQLPWTCCEPPWASNRCISFSQTDECFSPHRNHSHSAIILDVDMVNHTAEQTPGSDKNFTTQVFDSKFAADDYFHNNVLRLSSGLTDLGGVNWYLVLCLICAWVVVCLVLIKGIKSFGKAVYFTSTFPYFIIAVLLVNMVTKDGAVDGLRYYVTPKWEKLLEARVWSDAASQVFYSTGACFGGTITLASYNRFNNNLYRDAIIVLIGDCFTSIVSGFVVFSILGFMAHSQGTTVEQVVTSGPGLTFVTYPQSVILLPVSPLWSCLFFFMLFILALSTMFPTTENIITSLLDQWPDKLRPYKVWVTVAVCAVLCVCGMPLCTGAGMYWLQLVDSYGVGFALLLLGLLEVIVVGWIYGAERLLTDIESMIGFRPTPWFWRFAWRFVTPAFLLFCIVFTLSQLKPLDYAKYVYPQWAGNLGWCLTFVSIVPVPMYMFSKVFGHWCSSYADKTCLDIWRDSIHVNEDIWGPKVDLKSKCLVEERNEEPLMAPLQPELGSATATAAIHVDGTDVLNGTPLLRHKVLDGIKQEERMFR